MQPQRCKRTTLGRKQAVTSEILTKLQKLPAKKQAEVLDFVEALGSTRTKKRTTPAIYEYSAAVVKRKRLKRMSLARIDAIVHKVRNGHD